MVRPENTGPADMYYNAETAAQYNDNTRINDVQLQLTDRALELLSMEAPALLLEIGAGSGISTNYANEQGYLTIALDISMDMLKLNESDSLLLLDAGKGLPFQPGQFDGCFSISCLQWLCYSNDNTENPYKRLLCLFSSLFSCLKPGARAVFQFYPEDDKQLKLILDASRDAGFAGELIVDFPHSAKAKKIFLVLTGGITGDKRIGKVSDIKTKRLGNGGRVLSTKMDKHSREWILRKKVQAAEKGDDIRPMSKYSGKKREKWLAK
ncbi:S-adenosylmethionine-dependent methyltransferase [Spironucleus salmonicida]|uniref:Methyltransferase n=1 Tax=Spironucleus salmonicida TaxID=348837 RepID=V6LXT3_9EUKA|nr:S-adenosylmethionine-dependent methyltransferase [Spironucleus salmonicida]|eukprot:EST49447.1 Methyltransferase [Spironucleus salmonicida]